MPLKLKHYYQTKDYSCGPCCLKMVFEYLGKTYSEAELIKLCRITEKFGTSHKELAGVARKLGFVCHVGKHTKVADLFNLIVAKQAVIINYVEQGNDIGHYAVAIGYSEDRNKIILADPTHGPNFKISKTVLQNRWHNQNKTSFGWYLNISKK